MTEDLLNSIKENTDNLLSKKYSNKDLINTLYSRSLSFLKQPTLQTTVDICSLVLTIYISNSKSN
jgi:hypothetical protein